MTARELERHTSALLTSLHRELGESVADDRVEMVGWSHFERLLRGARVLDYIPLLVYSATKNQLRVS